MYFMYSVICPVWLVPLIWPF